MMWKYPVVKAEPLPTPINTSMKGGRKGRIGNNASILSSNYKGIPGLYGSN